jgi:hypothetical protein
MLQVRATGINQPNVWNILRPYENSLPPEGCSVLFVIKWDWRPLGSFGRRRDDNIF